MALDSSIPLMTRGPQIENPQNLLANSLRLRSAQMGLDQQQEQIQQRNALAAVLRQPGAYDESGRLNRSVLPQIGSVAPMQVPQYAGLINQQDNAAIDQDVKHMALARQRVQLQAQLLGTVKDQATYDQAKQAYAQAGGDASQLPPQYDPQWVAQARQGALTAEQQFDQHYKSAMLDLAQRRQSFNEQNPQRQLSADGTIVVDTRTGIGEPVTVDGKPVQPKPVTLNEGQAKANLFASRMDEADKILRDMASQGVDIPSVPKAIAESVPLVGSALGALANATVVSPEQQKVEQAQRDFINAVLRRESGAAISPSEFESAKKQYFPAIGDSPEVKAQKANNRRTAIDGMKAEVPANFHPPRQPSSGATTGKPSLDDIFGMK